MTKVKICGITDLEDAQLAVRLGADMLGFNFYEKSARYIRPNEAARIVNGLPKYVLKVGVFVNMEPYRVDEFVSLVGLDAVQIHGDEDEAFFDELRSETNAEIIKAYRIGNGDTAISVTDEDGYILLDSFSESYGGSGTTFDWSLAFEMGNVRDRIILAGGLTPENVAEAVKSVKPFGVDVASGVESSAGKKDPAKLEKFIKAAKAA
jgi:phosphoribosylanthranilate isomerase